MQDPFDASHKQTVGPVSGNNTGSNTKLTDYSQIVSLFATAPNSTNSSAGFDVDTLTSTQVFFNVLYCLTAILALIGNVGVLTVQSWCYRSPPLQNLKKYLINLAASDILFGALCVPFMYTDFSLGQWAFPHWLCPTVNFVQLLSVCVNSSTLMIIGIERYSALLYPFSAFYRVFKSHSYLLVGLTWIFGICYPYLTVRYTAVVQINYTGIGSFARCANYLGLTDTDRRILKVANFVVSIAFPALVLAFTYIAITSNHIQRGKVLKENKRNSSQNKKSKKTTKKSVKFEVSSVSINRDIRNNAKAIRITLTIVTLYGLCWLPLKLFVLLHEFGLITHSTALQLYVQQYLYIALHWLAMANSFVNPFVYTFSSQRFRTDLRNLIKPKYQLKFR